MIIDIHENSHPVNLDWHDGSLIKRVRRCSRLVHNALDGGHLRTTVDIDLIPPSKLEVEGAVDA